MKNFFKKAFNKMMQTLRSKPLLSTLIILSTFIGIILASHSDMPYRDFEYFLTKVLLAIHLILPTAISLELSKEYLQKKKWIYPTIAAFIIISLFIYVFSILPWNYRDAEEITAGGALFYKYATVMILSIISIFIVPYIQELKKNNNDFINKSMWGHVQQITGGLSSAIIFGVVTQIGLSLALGALNTLWGLYIDGWIYLIIAIFSYNFVGYINLISNIDSIKQAAKKTSLTNFLKGFVNYILLPLTAIYTVILYPYIIKVILTGDWVPNMITSLTLVFLLLTYSIVYILFFNKKLKLFKIRVTKLLPILSLPIILIQMYGFWIRIDAYGFTVNRTELLLFAVFSFVLSIYFGFSKRPKLIAAPILFTLYLIIATPISFILGKNSQLTKHLELMNSYNLIGDGKVTSYNKSLYLDYDQRSEISDSFEYLLSYHGLNSVKPILDRNIYKTLEYSKDQSTYNLSSLYLQKLNIEFGFNDLNNNYYYYYAPSKDYIDMHDLDLDITTIKAVSYYPSDYLIEPFNDEYKIKLEYSDTYKITQSQMDLLLEADYSSEEIIILDNLNNDSHLLIFKANILETKNDNNSHSYEITSLTAWILK